MWRLPGAGPWRRGSLGGGEPSEGVVPGDQRGLLDHWCTHRLPGHCDQHFLWGGKSLERGGAVRGQASPALWKARLCLQVSQTQRGCRGPGHQWPEWWPLVGPCLGHSGLFRNIWGQEVISPLATRGRSLDPGRDRPEGPEGSRPDGTCRAHLESPGQWAGGEAALSLGPAGPARGLRAKARVTTPFVGRLLCFPWQILITFYFDHTVECYISVS